MKRNANQEKRKKNRRYRKKDGENKEIKKIRNKGKEKIMGAGKKFDTHLAVEFFCFGENNSFCGHVDSYGECLSGEQTFNKTLLRTQRDRERGRERQK